VLAAAEAIAAHIGPPRWTVAFQSQGMSGSAGEWLGPGLPAVLDEAKERGDERVVFAPIGFLADHVEILYDLDIEGAALGSARGLRTSRAASLNADDDLVEAVADVVRSLRVDG
jgi:ferrochelatase